MASTTVSQSGIIQPSISYKQKSCNIYEEKITDEAMDIQISTIEQESSRQSMALSCTSLKAYLRQDINRGFAFSRCLIGTFP